MKRAGTAAAGLIGAFGVFCTLYALTHMRAWEWAELYPIVGVRGALFAAFMFGGLIALTWQCLRRAIAPYDQPYSHARRDAGPRGPLALLPSSIALRRLTKGGVHYI